MRYWLRGKWSGLLGLLVIAGLVGGGLGWVTLAALRLEQEQIDARAEAERSNKLRLALWRLDSRIVTDLAKEAGRPYHHYSVSDAWRLAASNTGKAQWFAGLDLVPLPEADSPPWMLRHFLLSWESDWKSPNVLRDTIVKCLNVTTEKVGQTNEDRVPQQVVAELANDSNFRKLLDQKQAEQPAPNPPGQPAPNPPAQQQDGGSQVPYGPNDLSQFAKNTVESQGRASKDTQLRANRTQVEQKGSVSYQEPALPGNKKVNERQVWAILGPMIPLWLVGGQQENLVVARLLQIDDKQVCQVTVLDWPGLQRELTEEVRDLFPEARLLPIREGSSPNPERALTALPAELDPGPAAATASLGWTPLRIGLLLVWAAALVALLAVGLGGWSLLDLSERRIRFVSAVTHELRTPLTTLRLYLDMLAGGMITDEQRKTEYLHTLNAEADRLNRLVGNVLDFSRLENQRPRLETTKVPVASILEDLRATWQDRCRDAGKQLVVDHSLGQDALVHTDVKLVQQILGNLIDNACKYSRSAEDARLWVRASNDHGRYWLIEVEDRGPGVPAGERRSIFRPFRRGHGADVTAGGVGLGLALAQRWARLLGGQLTCCSGQNGAGACFRLALPVNG